MEFAMKICINKLNKCKNIKVFVVIFALSMTLEAWATGASSTVVSDLDDLGPSYKRLKFGVVVNNEDYQIYRSMKLGRRGLKKLKKHLKEEGLPFPKTIIHMNNSGYRFPLYFAVQEYEILKTIDFKKTNINSIQFESKHFDGTFTEGPKLKKIKEKLLANGFNLSQLDQENILAKK